MNISKHFEGRYIYEQYYVWLTLTKQTQGMVKGPEQGERVVRAGTTATKNTRRSRYAT